MPTKSKATDLWSGFQLALQASNDRKPQGEGWMTLKEMQVRFKTGHCKLAAIIKDAKMEKFEGGKVVNGKYRRSVWYRPLA